MALTHEEWHITVTGDPVLWKNFCTAYGIKPLWIELNNFERQLMCAITSPAKYTKMKGILHANPELFTIIREKHEAMPNGTEQNPIYYECHVKLDGFFLPYMGMSSRDLYRENRWYATHRQKTPFDPNDFLEYVKNCVVEKLPEFPNSESVIAGMEYEVALVDTNPNLDKRWERTAEPWK
jgi:hypothetical protein